MKKGLSIQVKLIATLLLSVIVPILVIAFLSYMNASNALEQKALDQLTSVMEEKKDHITAEFEGMELELMILKDSVSALLEESFHRIEIVTSLKDNEIHLYLEDQYGRGNFTPTSRDFNHFNEVCHNTAGLGNTGETYIMERRDGRYFFLTTLLITGGGRYTTGTEFTSNLPEYLSLGFEGKSGTGIFADSTGTPSVVVYDSMDIPGRDWVMITKMNLEEVMDVQVDGVHYFDEIAADMGVHDLFLITPNGYVFESVAKKSDYHTNLLSGEYKDSGLGRVFRQIMEIDSLAFSDFEPYAPSQGAPAAFLGNTVSTKGKTQVAVVIQVPEEHINGVMTTRHGMGDTGESYLVGSDKLMRSDSYLDPEQHSIRGSFANPNLGSVDTKASREALAGKSGTGIIANYLGETVLSAYSPMDVFGERWAIVAEIDLAEAFASVYTLRNVIIIISAIVLVIVAVIGFLFSISISRPLLAVSKELDGASYQITSAATQLTNSSQIIASGAAEQASGIEETTSSVEELTSMVNQNAENAKQMNSLAKRSEESSRNGFEQMKNLLQSMEDLNEASDKIAQINQVIDSIAFQTNILALNAAVEAARAGEAGMGFAVVADEVKNLANKSAESAKQTGALIENSINQISNTLSGARELSELFNEIISQGTKVNEMSKEVEVASIQQSQGLDQINVTISQFEKVSQSNASSAEETAASADELSAQSGILRSVVEQLVRIITGKGEDSKAPRDEPTKLLPEKTGVAEEPMVQRIVPRPAPSSTAVSGHRPEDIIPFDEDEEFETL